MIDVDAPSAVAKPVSELAPEASAAQAAGSAPEAATAKAGADDGKTPVTGVGAEVKPGPTRRPVDVTIVPAKGAEAPASSVKRTPDDAPAPPPKRQKRRKPEGLGTRDGYSLVLR